MFCLVKLLCLPDGYDPKLKGVEFFKTFEQAKKKTEELIKVFFDEYGEDSEEEASPENPVAVACNGEVTWFGFIEEVKDTKDLLSKLA